MALAQNPSIAALSNLVLYYDASNVKSFPGAGTSIYDMSGNNNTGTLTNGPLWSAANNGIITFDGSDDYINTSFTPSNACTLSIWFYNNLTYNANNRGLFSTYASASFNGMYIGTTTAISNGLRFWYNGNANVYITYSFLINTWHNITVTSSGSQILIYVNGILTNTISGATTHADVLNIGRTRFDTNYWSGFVANFQVYNTALTAAQVQQNYNAAKSRFINTPFAPTDISGLAAWFDADDPRTLFSNTSGTTRANSDGNAVALWVDKSGNGRNASQSTANKCPTLKTSIINNRNVIRGDGSNDTLSLSRAVSEDFSIFVLFQTTQSYFRNSSTQWYEGAGLFDSEVGGVVNDYGVSMYQGFPRAGTGNPDTSITDPTSRNNGSPNLVCFTRLKSTGALNLYSNGIPVASGTGTTASLTSPTVNYLMSTADSFGYMNGDIAEVIVYGSVLSTANRIRVEQYFQNKWGFNLGFLPTQISGLSLWLDSSDSGSLFQDSSGTIPAQSNNDYIGMWKDKSGNSRHATQVSSTSSRPILKTNVQNGKPAVYFDGSGTWLSNTVYSYSGASTLFIVASNNYNNGYYFDGAGASIQRGTLRDSETTVRMFAPSSSIFSAATFALSNVSLIESYWNSASSQCGVNGQMNTAGTLPLYTMTGYTVGRTRNGSGAGISQGNFCEILHYEAVLTLAQRQQVEAYLNQKWGIF